MQKAFKIRANQLGYIRKSHTIQLNGNLMTTHRFPSEHVRENLQIKARQYNRLICQLLAGMLLTSIELGIE